MLQNRSQRRLWLPMLLVVVPVVLAIVVVLVLVLPESGLELGSVLVLVVLVLLLLLLLLAVRPLLPISMVLPTAPGHSTAEQRHSATPSKDMPTEVPMGL